jgi:hypothetical protein
MKLRIRGNSLRLRLTRGEVEQLANAESIVESIKFGIGEREQLVYSLETHKGEDGITAHYKHGSITVRLPVDVAKQWAETEEVSLEARQQLTMDTELKLLIEKDFVCLVGRAPEEDADAFPHPSACAASC